MACHGMAEVMSEGARHRGDSGGPTAPNGPSTFVQPEPQGTRGWSEVRRPSIQMAASASRSSVLQERGRSLLLPSAFRLEPIRGLQAQRARRRAPSLGTVTTRPLRSSSGADPQRITDATTPTNSAVDLGVWFPTIPPLVLYHDLRLHVDQDFRRDGGTRAGRLERVLGTTAALGCDHLYLCPRKVSCSTQRPFAAPMF